jgi:hypothetical protein
MSESRLPFHPYAELFPRMTNPEFEGLCGDIARKGLLEDIIRYEGKILEGRERYVACERKKVPPRFREYAGECGSPLEFVVSKNLHRRHLTEGQRALVAARLRPHFQEEARQRQLATLKKGSQSPVTPSLEERENQPKNAEAAEAGCRPPVTPSLEERGRRKKRDFSLNATAAGAAFLVGLTFVSARISGRPVTTRRTRPPEAYPVPVTLRLPRRHARDDLKTVCDAQSAQKITGKRGAVAHLQPPLGCRVERSVPTAVAAPVGRRWASSRDAVASVTIS